MESQYIDYLEKYCFYDGCRGLVKFIGKVDGMQNTYLGVEWDCRKRGKHNGSYNGKIYFECNQGCGSFIKPEKVVFGITIEEALLHRYSKDNNQPIDLSIFNSAGLSRRYVQVEMVGIMEKIDDYLNISKKSFINLDGLGINGCSKTSPLSLVNSMPYLEQLNLGYNLLTDFNDVFAIIEGCEKLNHLNLSKNFLDFNTLNATKHQNHTVKCLILCETVIPHWKEVEKLLQCFTAIEELTLGQCDISCVEISNIDLYKNILFLDLSNNKLDEWRLIEPLSVLPNLKTLVLRENRLKSIVISKSNEELSTKCYFPLLECLNLCENIFYTLKDIILLNAINALVDLRLNGNPILYRDGNDDNFDKVWCEIIAVFPNLLKLNLSNIDGRERRNAEIWFIKNRMETYQMESSNLFESNKKQFEFLMEKYQIKPENNTQQNTVTLRNHLYCLNILYGPYESKIKVPKNTKVRYLKMLAEKVLKTEIYCSDINFISSKNQQINKILYYNHDLPYNNIENEDTILFANDCVSPK